MNSGVQEKLFNLEATPPPGLWEKIAAELDESELSSNFPAKLRASAATPPAHIWQNIVSELNEPGLVNDYSRKLSAIAVEPPASAWAGIERALAADEKGRRGSGVISPFIKYAAAAVVLAFLAWGGIQLFNSKKEPTAGIASDDSPAQNSTATKSPAITLTDETIGVTGVTASMEEARNDAALEASKKTYAKLDIPTTRSKIKNASNFFFASDDYDYTGEAVTRGLHIGEPVSPPTINETNPAKRYITFTTPEGNTIRMSKKLQDLICCVSGEEEDPECDQMKKWRDKIANPARAHSTGNFIDILSMVNTLQDN